MTGVEPVHHALPDKVQLAYRMLFLLELTEEVHCRCMAAIIAYTSIRLLVGWSW